MASASISSRLRREERGGVKDWCGGGPTSVALWTGLGNVLGSIGPSRALGGRFSSSVPGGWMGSSATFVNLRKAECIFQTYILPSHLSRIILG